jgi:hypothetical protein
MANWIWAKNAVGKHQMVLFRRKFNISESKAYNFRISAEANFTAFIDGKEFLRGQYSDYPDTKTFTETELNLVAGQHIITVEVYYAGEDFQTSLFSEQPGLWCELESVLESDENWKARLSSAFLRDNIHKVTPQLGYATGFDARLQEDFHSENFDDSHCKRKGIARVLLRRSEIYGRTYLHPLRRGNV